MNTVSSNLIESIKFLRNPEIEISITSIYVLVMHCTNSIKTHIYKQKETHKAVKIIVK